MQRQIIASGDIVGWGKSAYSAVSHRARRWDHSFAATPLGSRPSARVSRQRQNRSIAWRYGRKAKGLQFPLEPRQDCRRSCLPQLGVVMPVDLGGQDMCDCSHFYDDRSTPRPVKPAPSRKAGWCLWCGLDVPFNSPRGGSNRYCPGIACVTAARDDARKRFRDGECSAYPELRRLTFVLKMRKYRGRRHGQ